MAKQFIFKDKYAQKLKNEVQASSSIDHYKSSEFVYDKKQVLMLPNIEKPEWLLGKLDAKDDCQTAIYIYEAFQRLEPIQASDERLWVYLAHVDLYPYLIKRWGGVYNNKAENPTSYILEHWFFEKGFLRNALAGFWWLVYLSVDETKPDKYELTRILFRQLDFATRTLGLYKLARHKEAVIGVLEFINENNLLFEKAFQEKARFIMKYLNLIGGVKPIAYYKRDFFKSELQKVSENISLI